MKAFPALSGGRPHLLCGVCRVPGTLTPTCGGTFNDAGEPGSAANFPLREAVEGQENPGESSPAVRSPLAQPSDSGVLQNQVLSGKSSFLRA